MDIRNINKDDWFSIAKIIDNNFNGKEDVFIAHKCKKHYLLTTNTCDDCSSIKVYFEDNRITKIVRVGEDIDGYQEIHGTTYERIINFLNTR